MTQSPIDRDLNHSVTTEKRHRPAALAPIWNAMVIQSAEVLSRYELWGVKQLIYHFNATFSHPAHVSDEVFDAFAKAKRASLTPTQSRLRIRAALRGWNRIRLELPKLRLPAPPQLLERRFTNPPFSLYPASFQEDLAAFCRQASIGGISHHLSTSGNGDGSKPPSRRVSAPLAALSVKTYLQLIRSAAGAQVRAGRTIGSITSISQIVTADALTILLAEMRARQNLKAGTDTVRPRQYFSEAQVVAQVVALARRWCGFDAEELKAIEHIRRNLPWRRSYGRLFRPAHVTASMRQFDDANAVRRRFELPSQLVAAAEHVRLAGGKMSRRHVNDVEFAVMSQLLRDSPIRIRALAILRIAGDRPNVTVGESPFLVIYAMDSKNHKL
jgi:hypothetical protein